MHHYARGIPRVTNVVCEHALINAFVDKKNPVPESIVTGVACDFDLREGESLSHEIPVQQKSNGNVFSNGTWASQSVVESLANLTDRLDRLEAIAKWRP